MKFILIALTLMTSLTLFARPFDDRRGGRSGPVTCSASETGWEEHWGGHRSCGECLAKHGECVETCSTQEQRCEVEGRVTDRRNTSRTEIFYGRGASRWDAEEAAMRDCRWSRAEGCRVKACTTSSETVSRQRCR